jgi:site-specific recombinase XerD
MSSLHKHSDSPYWYGAYRLANDRRVFKSTKQTDKRKARIMLDAWERAEEQAGRGTATERKLREIINQTLERLELSPLETPTRAEWFKGWLADHEAQVSTTTFKGYKQGVDLFLRYLGARAEHKLETLDERDISGFQRYLLAGGRAGSTVDKLLKWIADPLEVARKLGKIAVNPAALRSKLGQASGVKGRFSVEQVAALVQSAKGTQWEGLVLLGYTSGMRLMDAATLPWSAIDRVAGVISFTPRKTIKTSNRMPAGERKTVIGLHPDFAAWLDTPPIPFRPQTPIFDELAAYGNSRLGLAFARLMEKAGIENELIRDPATQGGRARVYALSFHSFRHGAASAVFNAHVNRQVAARVTGHAERGALDTYLHVDLEAAKAVVSLIPRLPRKS